MSTITAYPDGGDEPIIGLAASHTRAFLHALAARLQRAAQRVTSGALAMVRAARDMAVTVVRAASTTVQIAFARGGLQASVSLLFATSQLARYTLRAAAAYTVTAWRWTKRRSERLAAAITVLGTEAAHLRLWWLTLPLLAGVALMGVVALRHRRAIASRVRPCAVSDDERDQLAKAMFVVLATDGSVRVHGIPATLNTKVRTDIAQVAARAAEQRLESLVARGRPLSSLDLQAVNVAARSAVTQHLDAAA